MSCLLRKKLANLGSSLI